MNSFTDPKAALKLLKARHHSSEPQFVDISGTMPPGGIPEEHPEEEEQDKEKRT